MVGNWQSRTAELPASPLLVYQAKVRKMVGAQLSAMADLQGFPKPQMELEFNKADDANLILTAANEHGRDQMHLLLGMWLGIGMKHWLVPDTMFEQPIYPKVQRCYRIVSTGLECTVHFPRTQDLIVCMNQHEPCGINRLGAPPSAQARQ